MNKQSRSDAAFVLLHSRRKIFKLLFNNNGINQTKYHFLPDESPPSR